MIRGALPVLAVFALRACGQTFVATPPSLVINGTADSVIVPAPTTFQLTSPTPNTAFAFGSSFIVLDPGPPIMTYGISQGDLLIAPSSGVTPATISVALTPDLVRILSPGQTSIRLTLYGFQVPVTVNLAAPPPPLVTSVVNAASFLPALSVGSLISIFGQNIGPLPTSGTLVYLGPALGFPGYFAYSGPVGGTAVNFSGSLSPLLFGGTSQVNAVVPAEAAGQQSVTVNLFHYSVAAPPFTVILSDTAPAIFTVTQNGTGQGAILNQDGSANSASNPAAVGTVVQIFGNGAGVWNPVLQDGVLVPLTPPYPVPVAKVSATIGGVPAQIEYAGAAPGLVSGMLQVNALIPAGLASGNQPVVLTVGQNNSSAQDVTVAVQ
jgi:trimeric autotransporter adhesin